MDGCDWLLPNIHYNFRLWAIVTILIWERHEFQFENKCDRYAAIAVQAVVQIECRRFVVSLRKGIGDLGMSLWFEKFQFYYSLLAQATRGSNCDSATKLIVDEFNRTIRQMDGNLLSSLCKRKYIVNVCEITSCVGSPNRLAFEFWIATPFNAHVH